MPEYIEREALIAEYDRVHEGPAGGARQLMVDAPAVNVVVTPCKVGDMIYEDIFDKYGTGICIERKVVGFHIGEFPNWRGAQRKQYFIVHHKTTNTISHLNFDKLGKTVFLSKEEAEKVLKEVQNGYL